MAPDDARAWNRFDCYELAAQAPRLEARFLSAVHGGTPMRLADDFAGPAAIARAWAADDPDRSAIAVDADPEPIAHARTRLADHAARVGPKDLADRVSFQTRDVLEAAGTVDVIAALNFAACELHSRERLLTYLRHALCRLDTHGVIVLDLYGGPDAFQPAAHQQTIETDAGDLVYTWEQRDADPLTARVRNAMHFDTPDGRRLENAFGYDWRLWTVPELRDALREAGFRRTQVHLALGEAETGEGELLVRPVRDDAAPTPPDLAEEPDPDEPYVAYIVGRVNG